MNDLISKERLVDTLYDCGFQVLSDHTTKSTIEFEAIMKCINCIESQPVIYSVEKAQEDSNWIKAKEQLLKRERKISKKECESWVKEVEYLFEKQEEQ